MISEIKFFRTSANIEFRSRRVAQISSGVPCISREVSIELWESGGRFQVMVARQLHSCTIFGPGIVVFCLSPYQKLEDFESPSYVPPILPTILHIV